MHAKSYGLSVYTSMSAYTYQIKNCFVAYRWSSTFINCKRYTFKNSKREGSLIFAENCCYYYSITRQLWLNPIHHLDDLCWESDVFLLSRSVYLPYLDFRGYYFWIAETKKWSNVDAAEIMIACCAEFSFNKAFL